MEDGLSSTYDALAEVLLRGKSRPRWLRLKQKIAVSHFAADVHGSQSLLQRVSFRLGYLNALLKTGYRRVACSERWFESINNCPVARDPLMGFL
jgi:hypothetical protein